MCALLYFLIKIVTTNFLSQRTYFLLAFKTPDKDENNSGKIIGCSASDQIKKLFKHRDRNLSLKHIGNYKIRLKLTEITQLK